MVKDIDLDVNRVDFPIVDAESQFTSLLWDEEHW
jgi:hypothetical protein